MWSAGGGLQPGQAFDATRCEPSFQALIDAGGLPTGRALVPGCGRGYAVAALASEDRAVTGLEISETAKAAADAHLRGVGCTAGKVIVDDFFTHEPDQPYDLAFDSTFLCAIPRADARSGRRDTPSSSARAASSCPTSSPSETSRADPVRPHRRDRGKLLAPRDSSPSASRRRPRSSGREASPSTCTDGRNCETTRA